MAYQALYRKYRPSNFDEVVGQTHIIQTLKNAIANDRIAHAYLFCGPRGTGKTSIAKIFAKMLNCENDEKRPCGECLNCQMVQNNSHPDIIEIDAASNNGVDEVRNLIDKVKYAPMEGKYKVYIIDEVHMMSTGAFNALLKTIEEPPKNVIFILATTEPNKVLPTIISRCQRFDFTKVNQDNIVKRLQIVCKEEQIEVDEEALRLIAQLADGGMRDSLSILDQCVAYCSNTVSIDDVRQIYGVLTTDDLGQLFGYLYEQDIDSLISKLQDCSDKGMDLKRLTSDLITLLKDSIILDHSPNSPLVSEDHKRVIDRYMKQAGNTFRIHVLSQLIDTYNKYPYASNILDYLETALLKSLTESYEPKEDIQIDQDYTPIRKKNVNIEKKKEMSYDLPSEQEEIIENIEENTVNKAILDKNDISDVSRETFKKEEIKDCKIILNDEYILQLLVGANKQLRYEDTEKMKDIILYLSDLQYAKYANSLRNVKIIGSAETYLIVMGRNNLEAKAINELEATDGYAAFTKKLLGSPRKVFAIDTEQNDRVLKQFRERMMAGTLPEPATVLIEEEKILDSITDSQENQIKEIFPNIEFIED